MPRWVSGRDRDSAAAEDYCPASLVGPHPGHDDGTIPSGSPSPQHLAMERVATKPDLRGIVRFTIDGHGRRRIYWIGTSGCWTGPDRLNEPDEFGIVEATNDLKRPVYVLVSLNLIKVSA